MRKWIPALLLLVFGLPLLAACDQEARPVTMLPAQNAVQEVHCVEGQPRQVRAGEFRIDTLTVMENSRALERISGGRTPGDYFATVYNDAKQQAVPRFEGSETYVEITIHGVRGRLAPSRLPFLSGMAATPGGMDGICRGYASVVVSGNRITVRVPVRGGEHLGQVSVIFPRNLFEGIRDVLPCVTWGIPVHAPRLVDGPARSRDNTLCGLPGSTPGTTLFSQRVARREVWTGFAGVVKR
ncbi:hypothetical protein K2X96_03250 [Patescibacteria group bacterium]|jgi:hypothetical protein|nr:hypothetical protein [Patescibacteria group bacterium]